MRSGLSAKTVIALFVLKVGVGCLAGAMVHESMYADTWGYHRDAVKEYKLLQSSPQDYFTNIFKTGYTHGHEGFLQTKDSFWNDLKDNLIEKFISVLHIFTGARYYVNVILFNFLLFFGGVALYRLYSMIYINSKKELIIGCFLLPSFLFFTSTIHKEGIVASGLGIIFYNVYQLYYTRSKLVVRLFVLLITTMLLLFLRNYVVFLLLPFMLVWLIVLKVKNYKLLLGTTLGLFFVVMFFNVQKIIPSINLVEFFVHKQADFLALEKARTTLPVNQLKSTFDSFLQGLPNAFEHGFYRPFITDYLMSVQLLPLSIELLMYQLVMLVAIFFRKKAMNFNSTATFLFVFAFLMLIVIGYLVPVIGGIVRYRSVYLPFLVVPIMCTINWEATIKFLRIKK